MTGPGSDDDHPLGEGAVIRFPYSRVVPQKPSFDPDAAPIYGELSQQIGLPSEQTTGHWCSRCQQIWFGYLLEVACPTCGNRHG